MSTIKQRLDWAFKNEDNPKAQAYVKRYRDGLLNPELQAEGMKPIPIVQPKPSPEVLESIRQTLATGQETGLQTIATPEAIAKATQERASADLREDVIRAGKGLVEDFGERGQKVIDIFKSEQDPFSKAIQLVGQVAGGAVDVAERGVEAAVTAITPQSVETAVMEKAQALLDTAGGKIAAEAIAGGLEKWNVFKEKNPTLALNLEAAFQITEILTIGVGGPAATRVVGRGAEAVVEAGEKVVEAAVPVVKKGAEKAGEAVVDIGARVDEIIATRKVTKEVAQAQAESEVIREIIAPGLNTKTFRKALEDGRVTRPKQTFFFGKKPDIVEVNDRVKEISNTIQRRIPDASKVDEFVLSSKIKQEIETIAIDLEPKMLDVKLRDITPTETPIVKAINDLSIETPVVKPTAGAKKVDIEKPVSTKTAKQRFEELEGKDRAGVLSEARTLTGRGLEFEVALERAVQAFDSKFGKALTKVVPEKPGAVTRRPVTEDEFIEAFAKGEMDADTVDFIRREFGDEVLDNPDALRDLYKRAQNPSMVDSALNAWDRVKKQQQKSVEFVEFPGAKRFQEIFEQHLNKLTKGTKEKTLDDLWKIRKNYDNSIPDRVKQANDLSPISSQIQKDMWLQNRRILNDIINDSARGLGAESQDAFKDMSNLYIARQNIIGKAKLDVKGAPGAFGKAKAALLDKVIPFGVGAFIF